MDVHDILKQDIINKIFAKHGEKITRYHLNYIKI